MANSHEQARESAIRARDALKRRDAEKANVAVDQQVDKFAQAADKARREGWQHTGDTSSD